jgi:hypothetical protein
MILQSLLVGLKSTGGSPSVVRVFPFGLSENRPPPTIENNDDFGRIKPLDRRIIELCEKTARISEVAQLSDITKAKDR